MMFRHEDRPFHARLGDKQMVERILVMYRQSAETNKVRLGNGKQPKALDVDLPQNVLQPGPKLAGSQTALQP